MHICLNWNDRQNYLSTLYKSKLALFLIRYTYRTVDLPGIPLGICLSCPPPQNTIVTPLQVHLDGISLNTIDVCQNVRLLDYVC